MGCVGKSEKQATGHGPPCLCFRRLKGVMRLTPQENNLLGLGHENLTGSDVVPSSEPLA